MPSVAIVIFGAAVLLAIIFLVSQGTNPRNLGDNRNRRIPLRCTEPAIKRDEQAWRRPRTKRRAIAVCGRSGTGKSSLINRLRDLPDPPRGMNLPVTHDPFSAACVGVVETTQSCLPYTSPAWRNVDLWDLPGMSTPAFPRANYSDAVDLFSYDFYIVVVERWLEDDEWLVRNLRSARKPYLIVRTMLDQALRSEAEQVSRQTELGVISLIQNSIKDSGEVHVICALPNSARKHEFIALQKSLSILCSTPR